jgi:hypothetical protein
MVNIRDYSAIVAETKERLTKESILHFGYATIQSLLFISYCDSFIPNVDGHLDPEQLVRKYMLWQSRNNPKLRKEFAQDMCEGLTFSHDNDLTWKQCASVEKIIHDQKKAEYKTRKLNRKQFFVSFEELNNDPFKKQFIEKSPFYTKTETGYVKTDLMNQQLKANDYNMDEIS